METLITRESDANRCPITPYSLRRLMADIPFGIPRKFPKDVNFADAAPLGSPMTLPARHLYETQESHLGFGIGCRAQEHSKRHVRKMMLDVVQPDFFHKYPLVACAMFSEDGAWVFLLDGHDRKHAAQLRGISDLGTQVLTLDQTHDFVNQTPPGDMTVDDVKTRIIATADNFQHTHLRLPSMIPGVRSFDELKERYGKGSEIVTVKD
jgi:hypothetical protein